MRRKLRLIGRRNFLSTLGTMGISASAVDHLTKQELFDLTGDPTDRVPRLARLEATGESSSGDPGRNDRKPIFYTIPRDEWERREGTRKAACELGTELRASYDGIHTEMTTRVDGGHRELVVNVVRPKRVKTPPNGRGDATERRVEEPNVSAAELLGEVPETIDCTVGEGKYRTTVEDIPVTVEERTERLTSGDGCFEDGYFDDHYSSLAGGIQFMRADGIHSTICTPVYDHDEGEDRLLVTGHSVDHWDVVKYDRIYQPYPSHEDEPTDVGFPDPEKVIFENSAYLDRIDDAAVIDLTETDRSILWNMGTDDGLYSNEAIAGTIAFDTLVDNAGGGYTVYQQGRRTGKNEGTLGAISDDDNDLGYIRLNGVNSGFGDSGAPFYRIEENTCTGDDAIFLVGMQHSTESYRKRPVGNVIEFIETELNVEVNPNSSC